jgi:hypothetical protein
MLYADAIHQATTYNSVQGIDEELVNRVIKDSDDKFKEAIKYNGLAQLTHNDKGEVTGAKLVVPPFAIH